MKRTVIIIISIVAVFAIAGAYLFFISKTVPSLSPSDKTAHTPQDAAYIIEGNSIMLANGKAEQEVAPGSTAKITTILFGTPVYGDLNHDGVNDAAVMLTQNSGGSGTFFYFAAAINDNGTYTGTNAILMGDRVAPQNIQIKDGAIIANYADRGPNDPMTAQPSIGVSKYAVLTGTMLTQAAPLSEKTDLITVDAPLPGSAITSPLTITGQAGGNWYFEASFPVVLTDWNGNVIAQGHAEARSDWMTTDFVSFTATLTFTKPLSKNNGFLILKKDNPSGLSQYDDAVEIPVLFK